MACGMWVRFGSSLAGHPEGSIRLESQLTPIRGPLEGSFQRPRAASPRVTGVIPQSNPSESLPQLDLPRIDAGVAVAAHAARASGLTVFVGHNAPYEECIEECIGECIVAEAPEEAGQSRTWVSTISCHVRPPVADDSSPMTCAYGKNLDRLGIHSKSSKAQLEFS